MDDESRLVRAMARRDRAAWAVMYERHVGDVFGLVYHLVGGDRHVAEDINQEAWLLALERFDRFDPGRGGFRDWLMGIARHLALRHHRRNANAGRPLDGWPDGPSDALPPPELVEGLERADVVRAAMLCLRDEGRRVLLDKYAEGLAVAEIAARTGRSAKAVESLLSRARGQLRALLRPYFPEPSGGERREPTDARPI
jgi:RNA polymerase sigma-70 factor, ECF subfamily